jgi:hypothetical protein
MDTYHSQGEDDMKTAFRSLLATLCLSLVLAGALGIHPPAMTHADPVAVGPKSDAVSIFTMAPDPYCQSGLTSLFAYRDAAIPFTMVSSRNDNRFVSYTAGTLRNQLWRIHSTNSEQLFSDRAVPASCEPLCTWQPFYSQAADSLDVELFPNGFVTLYNNTWGGATSFMGRCIGTNQPLVYGYVGDTLFVLSFGQPRPRF